MRIEETFVFRSSLSSFGLKTTHFDSTPAEGRFGEVGDITGEIPGWILTENKLYSLFSRRNRRFLVQRRSAMDHWIDRQRKRWNDRNVIGRARRLLLSL